MKESQKFYSTNMDFSKENIQVIGYKTFRGMVAQFKKINKRYKKMGIKGQFTITLPMKY